MAKYEQGSGLSIKSVPLTQTQIAPLTSNQQAADQNLVKVIREIDMESSTPTVSDLEAQQYRAKCAAIRREFPNPQLATLIGDAYAAQIKRKEEQLQSQLDNAQLFASVDDFLWSAAGALAGFVAGSISGGTASSLAVGAVGYLAEKSTSAVDQWVSDLAQQLQDGFADPAVINQIAFIAGDPVLLQEIDNGVSQIPQGDLSEYLQNMIDKKRVFQTVVIPMWPSVIFDNSPTLQAKTYYALAVVDYTIQKICDRVTQQDTPLVAVGAGVTVAPSGSSLPAKSQGTVTGDGTGVKKKGGLLPLLAILGIGAYALL